MHVQRREDWGKVVHRGSQAEILEQPRCSKFNEDFVVSRMREKTSDSGRSVGAACRVE